MLLILLMVVLVLMFGCGGGYYGYRRWLASMTGEVDETIALRRADDLILPEEAGLSYPEASAALKLS